jgi:hypothetical protein
MLLVKLWAARRQVGAHAEDPDLSKLAGGQYRHRRVHQGSLEFKLQLVCPKQQPKG